MKALKLIILFLTVLPPAFAQADCAAYRTSLRNDVNSAIHTFPSSCRSISVRLQCMILFNNKLPALLTQLDSDSPEAKVNLRKIATGVNDRKADLIAIIDTPYLPQMNRIIRGLQVYVRQCVR